MPKIGGAFDLFENLDQIPIENVSRWFKKVKDSFFLENYLANVIFYPEAIPTTEEDEEIELAFLREALKHDKRFINPTSKKLTISAPLVARFPNLAALTWAFVDAYLLNIPKDLLGVWTVLVSSDRGNWTIGSVLIPNLHSGGVMEVYLEREKAQIKSGTLMVVPCPKEHCTLNFKLKNGTIFNQNEGGVEVNGGKLGIMIDGRSR